jgi:hypothetical protein
VANADTSVLITAASVSRAKDRNKRKMSKCADSKKQEGKKDSTARVCAKEGECRSGEQ